MTRELTAVETVVRLRVIFEDDEMLSKSKKKEGLKRCWVLLKPKEQTTISHLSSHLHSTFNLHPTCPNGTILSMDGFVLPPFESTCIFKDRDIVCVKRKGNILTDDKLAKLPSVLDEEYIGLPKLLAIEGFQGEDGRRETMLQEDESDQHEEDEVNVESNAISKNIKVSKKLKSQEDDSEQNDAVCVESNAKKEKHQRNPRALGFKKKIKLSSAEKLAVIHEEEENASIEGHINHRSVVNKDNDNSSKLSRQPKKSSNLDHEQSNNSSGSKVDKTRSLQPQDNDETDTIKMPSRSARRKKAKRKWLRELKLQQENEKLHPSPIVQKDGQQLSTKDNDPIVSDVRQQPDEESEAEDDIVPVEIRPGHIRFESLRKDQDVPQNQFPVETFQWNGTTSKKKGQKWGTERISSHKQDDYEHSTEESPIVHQAEMQHKLNPVDFDKLTPYTSSPKEGDVIAYRLIELSASWTPELSSFRIGRILHYDAKSNMIQLEPVSEYPFDFKKKIDGDESSEQFDPSPYGEDGSLEIDYLSLADARMVKHGIPGSATVIAPSDAWVNLVKSTNGSIDEKLVGDTIVGNSKQEREGHTPAKANGKVNLWDELNETLAAKKAKLSEVDGWSHVSSDSRSWSHRALRCSALGPTMARLRAQNGL
ncbi:putative coilin domain-containing protein [Lupinus albus]|uniref:Putative coilin domain-containing protein n=1 Tax=Lupinus albus TaxID=3870 RepID=A0A6A4Q2J3_LUPAL|nr:putative coilin domain-containing protein [Lupinus albus]